MALNDILTLPMTLARQLLTQPLDNTPADPQAYAQTYDAATAQARLPNFFEQAAQQIAAHEAQRQAVAAQTAAAEESGAGNATTAQNDYEADQLAAGRAQRTQMQLAQQAAFQDAMAQAAQQRAPAPAATPASAPVEHPSGGGFWGKIIDKAGDIAEPIVHPVVHAAGEAFNALPQPVQDVTTTAAHKYQTVVEHTLVPVTNFLAKESLELAHSPSNPTGLSYLLINQLPHQFANPITDLMDTGAVMAPYIALSVLTSGAGAPAAASASVGGISAGAAADAFVVGTFAAEGGADATKYWEAYKQGDITTGQFVAGMGQSIANVAALKGLHDALRAHPEMERLPALINDANRAALDARIRAGDTTAHAISPTDGSIIEMTKGPDGQWVMRPAVYEQSGRPSVSLLEAPRANGEEGAPAPGEGSTAQAGAGTTALSLPEAVATEQANREPVSMASRISPEKEEAAINAQMENRLRSLASTGEEKKPAVLQTSTTPTREQLAANAAAGEAPREMRMTARGPVPRETRAVAERTPGENPVTPEEVAHGGLPADEIKAIKDATVQDLIDWHKIEYKDPEDPFRLAVEDELRKRADAGNGVAQLWLRNREPVATSAEAAKAGHLQEYTPEQAAPPKNDPSYRENNNFSLLHDRLFELRHEEPLEPGTPEWAARARELQSLQDQVDLETEARAARVDESVRRQKFFPNYGLTGPKDPTLTQEALYSLEHHNLDDPGVVRELEPAVHREVQRLRENVSSIARGKSDEELGKMLVEKNRPFWQKRIISAERDRRVDAKRAAIPADDGAKALGYEQHPVDPHDVKTDKSYDPYGQGSKRSLGEALGVDKPEDLVGGCG